MKNKFIIRQSCLLFLAAFIWGVAFVAQSAGMNYVEPFTFNALRSLLGSATLIPCIGILSLHRRQKSDVSEDKKTLLIGGTVCGCLLFTASNLQQFGIQYTTVGKAGFITALYIIIVPVLGIFLHRSADTKLWISVVIALFGLYLLCMQGNFSLSTGDSLLLMCSLAFSFHIMAIDYFTPKVDGVKMSCIQFFVCGILSSICMFVFENPNIRHIMSAWLPILYGGVMSSGIAYTLQIIGQEGMNPTAASLILSMESVFSVLAGFILLHESLAPRELAGCFVMFAAIILAQLRGKP